MIARRLWLPALAGLLVALLVPSTVVTAAEPRVTTRSLVIPPSAFTAMDDANGYHNEGFYLAADAFGYFLATLEFPVQEVSIRRITLYAVDNVAEGEVCVDLLRWVPATQTVAAQVRACTAGATGSDVQVVSTTSIYPRRVNTAAQGSFLRVSLHPSQNLFAVKVTYSYGT